MVNLNGNIQNEFSTAYYSDKSYNNAFDNNSSTYWYGYNVNFPMYIGCIFDKKVTVQEVSIFGYNTSDYYITDYTLQGSNNTTTGFDGIWVDIQQYSSLTYSATLKTYIVNNTSSYYMSYRIKINSVYVNSTNKLQCIITDLIFSGNIISNKFLIKQNSNYYTVKSSNYDSTTNHNFTPLALTGGITPNKSDIDTFGFNDLSVLTNSMTFGSDTFIPINKFDNTAQLKLYQG